MKKFFVTLYRVDFLIAGAFNNNIGIDKNLQKNKVNSSPNHLNEKLKMTILSENLQKLKKPKFSNEFDFYRDFKIEEFYLLKYKNAHFLLLSGQTIIYSGWSSSVRQILESSINAVSNEVDKITLTDHTYSDHESSRRLRSLGGGIRRVLLIVQRNKKKLTNKQIFKDLEYFKILGNENKLVTQFRAIENNTRLHNLTSSSFAYTPTVLVSHANENMPEARRVLKKRDATKDPYCYLDYIQSISVKEMSKPWLEYE